MKVNRKNVNLGKLHRARKNSVKNRFKREVLDAVVAPVSNATEAPEIQVPLTKHHLRGLRSNPTTSINLSAKKMRRLLKGTKIQRKLPREERAALRGSRLLTAPAPEPVEAQAETMQCEHPGTTLGQPSC